MTRKYVLILLALYCSSSVSFTQSQPPPPAPRLILVMSIDQMRFDYLTRFDPLYKGGLRMLLDRGGVFTNAKYRHAATETGPGHSVILTGRHPSHSGIVANEWYDAYLDRAINVVDDPVQTSIGGAGRAASPANAIGFTIGDVLKTRTPRSHVVGVSMKDRSAILMAGRRADAAYWFENDGGNFVTSSFYMASAPAWLTAWNRRRSADRFAGQQWTRLLNDAALYDKYAGPDAVEGERDRKNITFPHPFPAKALQPDYYVELRRTPFADEVTLEFALEAMKQHELGKDAETDILAIGFSASDGVGHTYGADSHEIMDQMLRLDLMLQSLFKTVDSTIGLDHTVIVLTADHGSRPLVEVLQSRGVPARRAAPAVLEKAVADAFAKKFPGVKDLVSYFATDFYLDEDVIRQHNLSRKEVEQTAIAALMNTGLVERVYTDDDLMSTASSSDPFLALFQNAFFQPRSPQLTVLLKQDVYMNSSAGGTGHGSVYEFDRHVPVVFMGRTLTPGRYADASGPEDIAPTLARILGLEFPREHDARVLNELFSQSSAAAR